MNKQYIFIMPFFALLAGCSVVTSSVTFNPAFKDVKFNPRTTPAKVTKESEDILQRKGYVNIGQLSKKKVETCWGSDCVSFTCTKESIQNGLKEQWAEKAASYGGDLLTTPDTTLQKLSTFKLGKCDEWGEAPREIWVYDIDYRTGRTYKRTYHEKICLRGESIPGTECSINHYATVWRHEPEQAKYFHLLSEYFQNIQDRDWPDEVTQPEKVEDNSKYGFRDKRGIVVISPQFSNTSSTGWHEGMRSVAIGTFLEGKWGFINKTGEWVIPPTYDVSPGDFHEGLAAVKVDNKWGYIDKKGTIIIKPQLMDNVGWFSEGLAAVKIDKKWGYIDTKGNLIIKPQFINAYNFSNGLAAVAKNNKMGFIDKKGNIIITPQFDYVEPFIKGIARVKVDNVWRFINKSGNVIVADLNKTPKSDYDRMQTDPDAFWKDWGKGLEKGLK